MEAKNMVITKRNRGVGFVLINGKVVTVRSGKPVGATLDPSALSSRPTKDMQFAGAKPQDAKKSEGQRATPVAPARPEVPAEIAAPVRVSAPVQRQEESITAPVTPFVQAEPQVAMPPSTNFEALGEMAVSKDEKERKSKNKGNKANRPEAFDENSL